MTEAFDVAIIGGGVVGLATAMAITTQYSVSLVVLEAEERLAAHQSGHNSGVVHSGLYYKPGSLKARNCIEGREALYRFCQENGVACKRCGKIVVATCNDELPALEELHRRGVANGLSGLQGLGPDGIREHEPHATGIAGLYVPDTGVVDFREVAEAFARRVKEAGGQVRLNTRVRGFRRHSNDLVLETCAGPVTCGFLISCGGLWADRVAKSCGVNPGVVVVPFRGEYYELVPQRRSLVRGLIYPVPDPRFPFLGVHFTRTIHDHVEAGPNAVLAFKRAGYGRWSFSLPDTARTAIYPGFWRLARSHWKTAAAEMYRSWRKAAFVAALRRLVPEITAADLRKAGSGVRAQAVEPNGKLVDDFRVVEADRMIHVLNAPSPAATASISIGRTIALTAARNGNFAARPI
jgi:L-2-hydroxyglutarate oxidase